MSDEPLDLNLEIEQEKAPEAIHPILMFGRQHGMKLMTLGFVTFGTGAFLSISMGTNSLNSTVAVIGFSIYLVGRILHALSKPKRL